MTRHVWFAFVSPSKCSQSAALCSGSCLLARDIFSLSLVALWNSSLWNSYFLALAVHIIPSVLFLPHPIYQSPVGCVALCLLLATVVWKSCLPCIQYSIQDMVVAMSKGAPKQCRTMSSHTSNASDAWAYPMIREPILAGTIILSLIL